MDNNKTCIKRKIKQFIKHVALSSLLFFAGYELGNINNANKINNINVFNNYKPRASLLDSNKCNFLSKFFLPISNYGYACIEHEVMNNIKSLLSSKYYNNFDYYANYHISLLESLEMKEIKALQEVNGIEFFARYDIFTLKTAYYYLKNGNKDKKPVILTATSKYDNNAFISTGELIGSIRKKYKNDFLIMPVEVNSKEDLLNKLKLLTEKIGKISILIISAHGLVDGRGIQLGIDENGNNLFFTMYDEYEMTEMKKYLLYKNMPAIVLISCYAGIKNGFAEMLAKKTNAIVIAAVSYVYAPATLFINDNEHGYEIYGFPEEEDDRLSDLSFYKGENFWRLKRVIVP